jgi:hypothetical protein
MFITRFLGHQQAEKPAGGPVFLTYTHTTRQLQ